MTKVNLNLSYWDFYEKSEHLGVFDVMDVQKLLEHVYCTVAEKYGTSASIGKSTYEGYLIDGDNIPREGDGVPKPALVGHSIDIRFGRGHDTNVLMNEINELFGACNKYTSESGH